MMLFWSLIGLLALIALVFIWLPFIKKPASVSAQDRQKQNVRIFKSRLQELEAELEEGTLDATSFEELKQELELKLLEDVGEREQRATSSQSRGLWAPLVLSLAIPAAALGLYLQWGASEELAQGPQQQTAQSHPGAVSIEEHLAQLRARLEANPGDSQGWFTLGRTYLTLQRYQDAYEAFVKVGEIVGDHAEIIAQQAQALYFLNGNQMTPRIRAMVDRALELDPNDSGTLGLLGIYSYETGQYQEAIGYWSQMLNNLGPNVNREGLMAAIEDAKSKLAAQGVTYEPPQSDAAAPAPASIRVDVVLDERLQGQVSAEDVVFVYAQAVNGPRMPLAVARMQVKNLPASVVLDDSMAMGPMAKLSSVDQVQIKATVTKSGTPGAKPGDLVGTVSPVAVRRDSDQPVNVRIDQVVK